MAPPPMALSLADRVGGALWGMLIADALAMPSHWFYGGADQVKRVLGGAIEKYVPPPTHFPESIMALSSTGGAGRGDTDGEIIGTVINHGKKKFWQRGSANHYHCTLRAGESTLEGEMARLTMRSMTGGSTTGDATTAGGFDADRMQQEYVQFMTTPGSHNDAYASSYHRLFFQRRARGMPLKDCPSNDNHNVDAIDGLIVPAVVLLAGARESEPVAREVARQSVRVTRQSANVEKFVEQLSLTLRPVIEGRASAAEAAQATATRMFNRPLNTAQPDPVVACYIDDNWQSLLLLAAKHADFTTCLLANANAGGENVHRGLVLGALMGAQVGSSGIPSELKTGLVHSAEIKLEIDAFVAAHVSAPHDSAVDAIEGCAADAGDATDRQKA